MTSDQSSIALSGVTVVETGTHFAVPFAGRLLAALGASVIKVELPGGDPLRSVAGGAIFGYLNSGKKSVVVAEDVWANGGRLRRLLAAAQIWLDGREFATIAADPSPAGAGAPYPVHVTVTPFGLTGPWAPLKGNGLTAAGMGGFMHICGDAGREPLKNGGYLPEFQAGLFGALGALTGLIGCESGGAPTTVDVSLLECVIAFQERADIAVTHMHQDWVRRRRHEMAHPFTIFECADGFVSLAVGTPRHWANLCLLIGKPEWGEDTEMILDRLGHADEIDAILGPWLRSLPAAEIVRRCQEYFIPCGPVLTGAQILADAHLRERSFFVGMPSAGGDLQVPGAPIRWRWGYSVGERAPALGEHTADLLGAIQ